MNNKWKIQLSVGLICMILGFAITIQFRSVQKNNGAGTISGLRAAEIQRKRKK